MSERGAIILMYHHIAEVRSDASVLNVSPRHFAEQLEVLHREARPMRLDQLTAMLKASSLPTRAVAITLDDGYADNLTNAKPLLDRFDIPATVFVTAGSKEMGPEFWWDELERLLLLPGAFPKIFELSLSGEAMQWDLGESAVYTSVDWLPFRHWKIWEDPPTPRHGLYQVLCPLLKLMSGTEQQNVIHQIRCLAQERVQGFDAHRRMTSEEVAAIAEGHLIEVGAHTMTHPMLSRLSAEAQHSEIEGGRDYLEELVNRRVHAFAYPYGDYSRETLRLVRNGGFDCACSIAIGQVRRDDDPLLLPRHNVFDLNGDEFTSWLNRVWA
jgi:peptidoglycan/xylan/chitin deacetylase (PgdA/CDA1 family)